MAAPALTKRIPHTDHIGSLLRPKELVEKRFAFFTGQCTAEEVKALEDETIPRIVALQKSVGLTVLTDGEMRRDAYTLGIFEKLEGMTNIVDCPFTEYMPYLPYVTVLQSLGMKGFTSGKCTGKLRWTKPIYAPEFESLKQHVTPEDIPNLKVTICGPTWLHCRHGSQYTYDHAVYSSDAEYFADLVAAFRAEIKDLYDRGCRRIQFDDPNFAFFCSEDMLAGMTAAGVDSDKLLGTYIDVYNTIAAGRPADLVIGVHTCRGNMKGIHFSEGSYDRIAKRVLVELDIDVFNLEYDTDRAGGLEPLRYLPLGKHVVLGLVTTKSGVLEDMDTVKGRVHRAAEIISEGEPRRPYEEALSQISISPQCGFASVFEGNPITEEEQKQKLALLVDAARQIWG